MCARNDEISSIYLVFEKVYPPSIVIDRLLESSTHGFEKILVIDTIPVKDIL